MTLTLAAWLHNISPVIVRISGDFAVRWYGVSYSLGFIIGWLWLRSMGKRQMTPLSGQRLSDAMVALVMGVVLGGRLGYVVFYDPALLIDFSSSFPWWGLLKLNHGGMSSHGGMIGVALACWMISRGYKDESGVRQGRMPWLHVIDLMAVACTPGLGLGRVANFVNGELLGRIAAEPGQVGPWWSVQFPQERATELPLSLTPVDHSPSLTVAQSEQLRHLLDQFAGDGESYEVAYQRMMHTLQTGSKQAAAEVARQLEPLLSSRYPSQLLQGLAEGLVLGTILWMIWWKPRRPGVIGACFLLFYGVMRIATETVRLPDPQLTELKQATGLSMGQWLSVGMVLIGVGALLLLRKYPATTLYGGWRKPKAA